MNSKTIKKDNYNIHLIKTKKFKSIDIHIVLRQERKKDDYLLSALVELFSITSMKYKTKREKALKMEDLYSEYLGISKRRVGLHNLIDIDVSFINPKLVKDDFLEEAVKFPFDIINNPNFDETKLDVIKDKLNYQYKQIIEKPAPYAAMKSSEIFLDKDIYKTKFFVEPSIVNSITMDQMKEKYYDIINNSVVDIFVLGDFDNKIVDLIDKYNIFKTNNTLKDYVIRPKTKDKPKKKVEIKKGINQAQVILIYNIKEYGDFDYHKGRLFGIILGGGALTSRLFNIVREEHHLCYNISASYNANDNSLTIFTSLDSDNIDKALKLIDEIVNSMNKITDDELKHALSKVISSISTVEESLTAMYMNDLYIKYYGRIPYKENINYYKKVSKKEVESVLNDIKLNTVYILKGDK